MDVRYQLLLVVFVFGSLANAHYTINMQLSSNVVSEGDHVTVTCDVNNEPNVSFTLVWVKRIGQDEVNIGSNSHLEEAFKQTGRYRLSYGVIKQLTEVKFTLTITGVTSADAGEIGCRIPAHGIELFKNFTVLVPVQSVRLMSRNVDDSHVQSYSDGRQVTFIDGEIRRVLCKVNGSHPEPSVRVLVGETDVTSQFTSSMKTFRVGPTTPKGPMSVYYSTELYNPEMRIGFELSGKSLRCIAIVPGSNFTDVSTSIVIAFASYRPKFVNCAGPRVIVPRYQQQVHVDCDIQAQPAVDKVWVRWKRSDSKNVILVAGHRDGHYMLQLKSRPESDMLRRMTLSLDRIYPQHFRNYTFIAQNSEGISEFDIQLIEPPNVAELLSSASLSATVSIFLETFSLFLLVVTGAVFSV